MPTKKRQTYTKQSRLAAERRRAQSRRRMLLLLGAVIAVALVAVGVIALLNRQPANPDPTRDVSMDKSLGLETAPVVVVEFADFQCPFCKQFAEGPQAQLKTEYIDGGRVRFAFRHLAFIGEESQWAAEASECANEQGRFWEYHDRLYAEQGAENSGALARDHLKRFAADLELDTAGFNECLDSSRYRDKVAQEIREAQIRRLTGTPSLLVNGVLVPNGADYQVLKAAIDAALVQE